MLPRLPVYRGRERMREIEVERADLKVKLAELDAEEVRLKQEADEDSRPLPPPLKTMPCPGEGGE